MEELKIKLTWYEKIKDLQSMECIPLDGTPIQSVHSAIRFNKEALKGKKFRVSKITKSVCRVK